MAPLGGQEVNCPPQLSRAPAAIGGVGGVGQLDRPLEGMFARVLAENLTLGHRGCTDEPTQVGDHTAAGARSRALGAMSLEITQAIADQRRIPR